jgi:hypothetical protein
MAQNSPFSVSIDTVATEFKPAAQNGDNYVYKQTTPGATGVPMSITATTRAATNGSVGRTDVRIVIPVDEGSGVYSGRTVEASLSIFKPLQANSSEVSAVTDIVAGILGLEPIKDMVENQFEPY